MANGTESENANHAVEGNKMKDRNTPRSNGNTIAPQAKPKWTWIALVIVALLAAGIFIAWLSGPMSDQEMAERDIDLCWGIPSNNPVHDEVKLTTNLTCFEKVKKYEAIYGKSPGMRRY